MGDGAKKATAIDYGVSAVQLSRRLLWYSWVPWVVKIGRLLLYALVLLPGFARVLAFYLLSSRVKRGLRYGPHSRNFLDVYLPPAKLTHRSPTIVFVTGGMWIIGYKGWGALLCKRLADCGFLVFSLDYRNFPQGTISSMEADVASGIAWSIRHCERYGGDCSTITIVGQSAGAHLASLAIVKQSLHESLHHPSGLASAWPVRDLTGFVGISGIYGIDNEDLLKHFERRGLKVSTVRDIMDGGQLARCSPLAIVQKHPELGSKMPRTLLIHGSSDRSAPPNESANFAQALRESGCSLSGVWEQYYAGMSHTDPFIECPMHGGEDALVRDVARFALKRHRCSKASDFDSSVQHTCDAHALEAGSAHSLQSVHSQQLVPSVCVWIARQVVPF